MAFKTFPSFLMQRSIFGSLNNVHGYLYIVNRQTCIYPRHKTPQDSMPKKSSKKSLEPLHKTMVVGSGPNRRTIDFSVRFFGSDPDIQIQEPTTLLKPSLRRLYT